MHFLLVYGILRTVQGAAQSAGGCTSLNGRNASWLLPARRGGDGMVTYEGLFAYTSVILSVIALVVTIMNNKKK